MRKFHSICIYDYMYLRVETWPGSISYGFRQKHGLIRTISWETTWIMNQIDSVFGEATFVKGQIDSQHWHGELIRFNWSWFAPKSGCLHIILLIAAENRSRKAENRRQEPKIGGIILLPLSMSRPRLIENNYLFVVYHFINVHQLPK